MKFVFQKFVFQECVFQEFVFLGVCLSGVCLSGVCQCQKLIKWFSKKLWNIFFPRNCVYFCSMSCKTRKIKSLTLCKTTFNKVACFFQNKCKSKGRSYNISKFSKCSWTWCWEFVQYVQIYIPRNVS